MTGIISDLYCSLLASNGRAQLLNGFMAVDARRERLAAIGSGLRRGAFVVTLFSLAVNLLVLAAPLYMLQVFDRVLTSRSQTP